MINVGEALKKHNHFSQHDDVSSVLIKDCNIDFDPLLSIVIPTYKRPQTLRMTIESALGQNNFDYFVIIVCDNNPERNDETEQYIDSIQDNRIKYYKNSENIGLFGNWNRIFELSESSYTVIIHDDDLLCADFLSVTYKVMTSHQEVDMLYVTPILWNENEMDLPKGIKYNDFHITKIEEKDLLLGNPFAPTGMIVKTDKILESGGFDEKLYPASDFYFNTKAILNMNVFFLKEKLYIYRRAINTCFKLETQLAYPAVDIPLRDYISKRIFSNRFIQRIVITEYLRGYFKGLSKHPNYDAALLKKELGYNPSFFLLVVCRIYIHLWPYYLKILHFLNTKKV